MFNPRVSDIYSINPRIFGAILALARFRFLRELLLSSYSVSCIALIVYHKTYFERLFKCFGEIRLCIACPIGWQQQSSHYTVVLFHIDLCCSGFPCFTKHLDRSGKSSQQLKCIGNHVAQKHKMRCFDRCFYVVFFLLIHFYSVSMVCYPAHYFNIVICVQN